MKKCWNCGAEVESKFCTRCGTEYKPDSKCANCGATVTGGMRFCGECGHKIDSRGDFIINDKTVVKYIGEDLYVAVPSGITTIGEDAFYKSPILEVTLPSTVKTIEYGAFSNCSRLRRVKMSKKLEILGDEVFSECEDLSEIDLPDTVEIIGRAAFYHCKSIKKMNISPLVRRIAPATFSGCIWLSDITLPESIESIGRSAFYECYRIREIVIPDNVEVIDNYAFYDAGLRSVIIGSEGKVTIGGKSSGSKLNRIGDEAFRRCEELEGIQYNGTVREWRSIKKGDDWIQSDVDVECADGDVTEKR